jgi:hypothetical protein
MAGRTGGAWRLTVTAASLAAALALGGAVASQDNTARPARILFPPDHAVLLSGHFDVIVQAPRADLVIDGRPQAWEAFAPPVHVLRVSLDPGPHKLQVAGQTRELVVAAYNHDPAAPRDWPVVRRHPINSEEERCGDCHQLSRRDSQIVLGELKGQQACFECHHKAGFDAAHARLPGPLESCPSCHALHASSRKSFLKPGIGAAPPDRQRSSSESPGL